MKPTHCKRPALEATGRLFFCQMAPAYSMTSPVMASQAFRMARWLEAP